MTGLLIHRKGRLKCFTAFVNFSNKKIAYHRKSANLMIHMWKQKMHKTKSTVKNSQVKCTSPPLNPKLTVNMVNNSPHLLLTGDFYIQKLHFLYVKFFLIRNLMLFIHLQHIYCPTNQLLSSTSS